MAADDAITTSVRLISIVQLSSPTLEELEFVRKYLAGQDRGVRGMAYSEAIKKSQLNPVFADVLFDVAAADPEHGDLPIAFLAGQPEAVIGKLGPKFRKLFLDQRHSEKGRASALRALANLKQDVPPADLVSFFCFAAEERSQAMALETAKKLNLHFDDASKKIMRSKALSPEVLKRF